MSQLTFHAQRCASFLRAPSAESATYVVAALEALVATWLEAGLAGAAAARAPRGVFALPVGVVHLQGALRAGAALAPLSSLHPSLNALLEGHGALEEGASLDARWGRRRGEDEAPPVTDSELVSLLRRLHPGYTLSPTALTLLVAFTRQWLRLAADGLRGLSGELALDAAADIVTLLTPPLLLQRCTSAADLSLRVLRHAVLLPPAVTLRLQLLRGADLTPAYICSVGREETLAEAYAVACAHLRVDDVHAAVLIYRGRVVSLRSSPHALGIIKTGGLFIVSKEWWTGVHREDFARGFSVQPGGGFGSPYASPTHARHAISPPDALRNSVVPHTARQERTPVQQQQHAAPVRAQTPSSRGGAQNSWEGLVEEVWDERDRGASREGSGRRGGGDATSPPLPASSRVAASDRGGTRGGGSRDGYDGGGAAAFVSPSARQPPYEVGRSGGSRQHEALHEHAPQAGHFYQEPRSSRGRGDSRGSGTPYQQYPRSGGQRVQQQQQQQQFAEEAHERTPYLSPRGHFAGSGIAAAAAARLSGASPGLRGRGGPSPIPLRAVGFGDEGSFGHRSVASPPSGGSSRVSPVRSARSGRGRSPTLTARLVQLSTEGVALPCREARTLLGAVGDAMVVLEGALGVLSTLTPSTAAVAGDEGAEMETVDVRGIHRAAATLSGAGKELLTVVSTIETRLARRALVEDTSRFKARLSRSRSPGTAAAAAAAALRRSPGAAIVQQYAPPPQHARFSPPPAYSHRQELQQQQQPPQHHRDQPPRQPTPRPRSSSNGGSGSAPLSVIPESAAEDDGGGDDRRAAWHHSRAAAASPRVSDAPEMVITREPRMRDTPIRGAVIRYSTES